MLRNRNVMSSSIPALLPLAALAALAGCTGNSDSNQSNPSGEALSMQSAQTRLASDVAPHAVSPQAVGLRAGAAEATADLPIGTPLAAYTSRLRYSGLATDRRTTPYTTEFSPSSGAQTRIPIKVIWLENNGEHAVFVKVDTGYSFDGLTFGIEDAISSATGIDVHDKVLFSTSHSHSSYGCFSHDVSLYLGSDQFNTEIYTRLLNQIAAAALSARTGMADAAIGIGFDPNFDPVSENRIFRDRRDENDVLVGVDGQVLGKHKDPRLTLIRIDKTQGTSDPADDKPLALVHHFGMHGTIMGGDNPLTSVESTGHVDLKLQEKFQSKVVVMHLQGAAGDQSPAGIQNDFARMESLGEQAAPKIMSLYNATRTRSGDVPLEMLTRSIRQDRDEMSITRGGTVNYTYTPFTDRYKGDDIVYNTDGTVASPIDEFNSENGAALCTDDPSMKIVGKLWGWNTNAAPYYTCGNVEEIVDIMQLNFFNFDLDWVTAPLVTATTTVISALKFSNVPVYSTTSGSTTDSVVFGIFPGEPVSLFSDTFRQTVTDRYGYANVVTIGYSQDHEGYLLTLEDWLAGGYEPEINQWGPIQGEYILEQTVELVSQFGIDNPAVPATSTQDNDYSDLYFPLNPATPDYVTNAGTVPSRVPAYVYAWDGVAPRTAQPDAKVQRLTGIASFLWVGGDAIVDYPSVAIQRESPVGSGQYVDVLHPSGRPWSDVGYEVMVTYTPDPLDWESLNTHYWYATFQAVQDEPSLEYSAGLALGKYRFKVLGKTTASSGGSFPFQTTAYSLYSDPFEITANTELKVAGTYASGTLSITASYPEATRGFRLISMSAENARAVQPLNRGSRSSVQGSVAVYDANNLLIWQAGTVTFTTQTGYSGASVSPGVLASGIYSVVITDVFGNLGKGTFTVP